MKIKMGLTGLLLLSVLTWGSACQQKTTSTSKLSSGRNAPVSLDGLEKDILKEINAYRKKMGRPALQMMDAASAQAELHSKNMAAKKTGFGHDGFESRISAIRKQATGSINAAAENVAYGQLSAAEVVDGWVHSPGHKKNIEGDYNLTGIGVARAKNGTIYYTQIFLRK